MKTAPISEHRSLTKALIEFFITRAKAKSLYDKADAQLRNLRRRMRIGVGVPLPRSANAGIPAGKKAVLKNNWTGKDEVWGHGKSRKFDIELEDV